MALEQIKDRLARLNALAERWNDTDINAIERDLALEHLRAIYDELSFYAATAPTAAAQPSATPATAPATAAGTTVAAAADNSIVEIAAEEPATLIDDPIDIDILLGLSSPEQELTETEMETALVPTAEPEAETETKVETAKPVANTTDKEVVVAIAHEPEQPAEAIEATPEPAEETAPEPEQPAEPAEEVAPEAEPEQPADETAPESIEESAPNPEIPAAETAPEPEQPAEESVPAPEPEQPAEQPAKAPMGGLFDINEIPIRSKRRRNIMISLYEEPVKPLTHDDKPAPTSVQPERNEIATQAPEPTNAEPATTVVPVAQPEHEQLPEESISAAPAAETVPADDSAADNNTVIHSEPQPAEPEPQPQRYTAPVTPQPAPTPRLADILAGEVTTLADSMISGNHLPRTAASARIDDLRKAIGINDRFLMIRDLFNGDAQMFEDTITTLNEFDDLDECMIYIVENFAWNPDSDGAKLLMSLIERKLA